MLTLFKSFKWTGNNTWKITLASTAFRRKKLLFFSQLPGTLDAERERIYWATRYFWRKKNMKENSCDASLMLIWYMSWCFHCSCAFACIFQWDENPGKLKCFERTIYLLSLFSRMKSFFIVGTFQTFNNVLNRSSLHYCWKYCCVSDI